MSERVRIPFAVEAPVTRATLTEEQKQVLHLVTHVFPNSELVTPQGQHLRLSPTKRKGCPSCQTA